MSYYSLNRAFALAALTVGGLVTVTPVGAVTLIDLHDPPGTHGVFKTDGVAWFRDQHDKHQPQHTQTFLALGDNDVAIEGYNNDAALHGHFYDDVDENNTRPLRLSEVPLVSGYRVFYLDANQSQTQGVPDHIDLEELEIGTTNEASNNFNGTIAGLRALWHSAYSLDKPGDDFTVRVEGEQGTARADMHLYVPDSFFTRFGSEAETFVYLYSRFTNNNDGHEHWIVDKAYNYEGPPGTVPEPASMGMIGASLLMLARRRCRCESLAT